MNTDALNCIFLASGFVLAIIIGMIIIPKILLISYKKQLFDIPDERKVHKTPIPRLGGLSFFPVILIVMSVVVGTRQLCGISTEELTLVQTDIELLFIFGGLTMLYLVGEADDLIGVGYKPKFIVQILASVLMVVSGTWMKSLGGLFGIWELHPVIGIPLSIVIVVFITNAINLIDGIDGLASGLCSIALAVLSGMLIMNREFILAQLTLCTLGVIIPFWFYNVFGNARRGHKLFMGDAGSLTLGYLLSFIVIKISQDTLAAEGNSKDMIIAFSTLLVPMLDVVRVVLHRLRKHRNPFLPDKNHIHHKLLRTGMRARYVLITILLITVFFIVFNAVMADYIDITVLVILDIVLWTALHLIINKKIKYSQHEKIPDEPENEAKE